MSTPALPVPTPVTPELDGDYIVLRFGDTSPFGTAEVATAGDGELTFDPAAPDRLIEVRVAEPEDAEATLTIVVGPAAAAQVTEMWASGDVPGPVLPEPMPALAGLGRLALVSWLEQWTPLDIPGQALLLDVGTQAHAAGHPLLALRSFASSADYLVALAERSLETPLPVPVAQGIGDALTAAADSLKQGHPLSARIAELAVARARASLSSDEDWDARLQALLQSELVAVHGIDPDLGTLFSVDWALVPSRVLHQEEGQGHLTIRDSGLRITVIPARWLDVSAALGLQARLLDPETGAPLAIAPLVWDSQTSSFAADFPYAKWPDVAPDALEAALPEVYAEASDGTRPAPRIGEARDSARAWREAVRALTRHRRSSACELALGRRLDDDDRMAAMQSESAAFDLDAIGHSHRAAALRSWADALDGAAPGAAWPTGLPVPQSLGLARPTLAEMVEVVDPTLFDVATQ